MSEIERLKLYDIPLEILNRELAEWEHVLRSGCVADIWSPGALCDYCGKYLRHNGFSIKECDICPLPPSNFCTSLPKDSLLHPENQTTYDWKSNIESYLLGLRCVIQVKDRGD